MQVALVAQAWSPDGKRLAICSFRRAGLYADTYGVISINDAASGNPMAKYEMGRITPTSGTATISWSPDGKDVLVVSSSAEIWRVG